jgi:uncharacterized protein
MDWNKKEIFEMKLTVATDCILRCKYCFVDKSVKTRMSLATAKKAIDFFLGTSGKDKILKMYGGEPLLNFELVKAVVPYAKKIATKRGVNLTLSLCTNAVMLSRAHLDFFKKYNFQLAISFDGRKKTYDKNRQFPDGSGAFDRVVVKFPALFETMRRRNVAANMSIVPSQSKNIISNFEYVLESGFDTINLEPVYGFERWTAGDFSQFEKAIKFIAKKIILEAKNGNFIFLTTANRELKYKTLSKLKNGVCLFHQFPEIYPDGRIGFSSFLLNLPKKKQAKYIVGNVNESVKDVYRSCVFDKKSAVCRDCYSAYFDIPNESMSSGIVKLRNLVSIELARKIELESKKNLIFKKYIKEAKKHICF